MILSRRIPFPPPPDACRPPSDPIDSAPLLWDATNALIDASTKATVQAALERAQQGLALAQGLSPSLPLPPSLEGSPQGVEAAVAPTSTPSPPPMPGDSQLEGTRRMLSQPGAASYTDPMNNLVALKAIGGSTSVPVAQAQPQQMGALVPEQSLPSSSPQWQQISIPPSQNTKKQRSPASPSQWDQWQTEAGAQMQQWQKQASVQLKQVGGQLQEQAGKTAAWWTQRPLLAEQAAKAAGTAGSNSGGDGGDSNSGGGGGGDSNSGGGGGGGGNDLPQVQEALGNNSGGSSAGQSGSIVYPSSPYAGGSPGKISSVYPSSPAKGNSSSGSSPGKGGSINSSHPAVGGSGGSKAPSGSNILVVVPPVQASQGPSQPPDPRYMAPQPVAPAAAAAASSQQGAAPAPEAWPALARQYDEYQQFQKLQQGQQQPGSAYAPSNSQSQGSAYAPSQQALPQSMPVTQPSGYVPGTVLQQPPTGPGGTQNPPSGGRAPASSAPASSGAAAAQQHGASSAQQRPAAGTGTLPSNSSGQPAIEASSGPLFEALKNHFLPCTTCSDEPAPAPQGSRDCCMCQPPAFILMHSYFHYPCLPATPALMLGSRRTMHECTIALAFGRLLITLGLKNERTQLSQ